MTVIKKTLRKRTEAERIKANVIDARAYIKVRRELTEKIADGFDYTILGTDYWESTEVEIFRWDDPALLADENYPKFSLLLICPITEGITQKKVVDLLQKRWPEIEELKFYLSDGKERHHPIDPKKEQKEILEKLEYRTLAGLSDSNRDLSLTGYKVGRLKIQLSPPEQKIYGERWHDLSCPEKKKILQEREKVRKESIRRIEEILNHLAKRKTARGRKLKIQPKVRQYFETMKERLSAEDREFLTLLVKEQWPFKDIASHLGITKQAVSKRFKKFKSRILPNTDREWREVYQEQTEPIFPEGTGKKSYPFQKL